MHIIEAGDNVQRGISVVLGGLSGGIAGSVCCFIPYIIGGAVSSSALRFQYGGPISTKDGAVIGAMGGFVAGILGGFLAGIIYPLFLFPALGLRFNPLFSGVAIFFASLIISPILSAIGGAILAKIYK
ncbi:MAG: hypothetical protein QXW70_02685 [Candidatus Anstonellales archaeon]